MICLLHGSDQVKSREKLSEIKSQYPASAVEVISVKDIEYSSFSMLFSSQSLFDEKRLVVVEGKLDAKLVDLSSISGADLVIWVADKLRSNEALVTSVQKAGGIVLLFESKEDIVIFPFLDAVAGRQRTSALREYVRLLGDGKEPLYILSMLVWQFRHLIDPEMASGFIKKKVDLYKDNFSFEELRRIYYQLLQIEVQIKTGEGIPHILIEQFVLKITK